MNRLEGRFCSRVLVSIVPFLVATTVVGSDAAARCEMLSASSTPEPSDYRFASSDIVTVPIPVAGSGLVRGRSTILVKAPLEKVREVVLGFSHYAEFMPHHRACRVLGRTPRGGRDVYVEVAVLHGAVRLWARIEMQKPRIEDGAEVHRARFLEGNVKNFDATWRLKRVDDKTTELTLEVFLVPQLPVPSSVLNRENLDGSAAGVLAMRARAEQAAAGG